MQLNSLIFYGKSLKYGCKHIHQSMPKILTIWLEFASRTNKRDKNNTVMEIQKDCMRKMTEYIGMYLNFYLLFIVSLFKYLN